MGETSKSQARRIREGFYEKYISLPGIDIGSQNDLILPDFRAWDYLFGDSDATLMEGVCDDYYQTVYASHILEHLDDPHKAIKNWFRILKLGGFLIICVPHRDLYEKKPCPPSRWNLEHKTFWLPESGEFPALGLHRTVQQALVKQKWKLESLRVLDENYVANGGAEVHPGGEYSIEIIIQKVPSLEYLSTLAG